MSDHTPASEKPLTEIIIGVLEHHNGMPKSAIGINLGNRQMDTSGLSDALDQLVEEGRVIERNEVYWLPGDKEDDA
ncbi:hypothetical protein [Halorubrum sp. CSM-61]|uniref:hypothetical protein n=1 Tax=Halorubrum sp. CSM-61 TaxID=2485838 RepID=UPI000F4B3F13|nr:hypothetical protein [Halorubrum sp. CSM-61]